MDIKGQVAVITGAGSGIGQAVAVSLAKRGVKALGLMDRNESVRNRRGDLLPDQRLGSQRAALDRRRLASALLNSERTGQYWRAANGEK